MLQGHRRRVNGCVSDARGKLIMSVGWDFAIKLWSGVTGESQGDLATDRFAVHPFSYMRNATAFSVVLFSLKPPPQEAGCVVRRCPCFRLSVCQSVRVSESRLCFRDISSIC